MSYIVAIPNRFPEVIQPLIDSIQKYEKQTEVYIVADGHNRGYGYEVLHYKSPNFVFSAASNIGIMKGVKNGKDVFLINDDIRLIEFDTFGRLYEIMQVRPKLGILSPLIKGCVGQAAQHWYKRHLYHRSECPVLYLKGGSPFCFPFVLFRKEMVLETGPMDESFVGYGGDDLAYSRKVRKMGWMTGVTPLVTVEHGDGSPGMGEARGRSWSVSYKKRYG